MTPPSSAVPVPAPASLFPPSADLRVNDWSTYDLVIDARSPHEYAEDHIPGALNLPVVGDDEFATVGTLHRDDAHQAYVVGAAMALRNLADAIDRHISKVPRQSRLMVYCFRGGKRSELWATMLRNIGFKVDVVQGGWKNYRRWVRDTLETLPAQFDLRVLSGRTNSGKTRLLAALAAKGHQVLDLEALAKHRGSMLGPLPDEPQPPQKWFDTLVLHTLRHFDPQQPVWVESESKKIGRLQVPEALMAAMRAAPVVQVDAAMPARVALCREDYPHHAADPLATVRTLEPQKPLIGGEELALWTQLAQARDIDALSERMMARYYDPLYDRSLARDYPVDARGLRLHLDALDAPALDEAVRTLARWAEPH